VTDPRVRGTVSAVERRLLKDGFVMRYDTEMGVDGLPSGEGAFLACSFWLADNYVLQERPDEAQALFKRLLTLCNDVGLLAEEYEPHAGRMRATFRKRSAMSGSSTQRSTSTAPRGPPEHAAAPDVSSITWRSRRCG
jgi:hypothetical protein